MKNIYIIVLIVPLLFFTFCGKKKPVLVMKAGDQGITGETLLFYYKQAGIYSTKKEVTTHQVKSFGEKYLVKNLLYQTEGFALGLDRDSLVVQKQDIARQKIMTQDKGVLFDKVVPENPDVAEKEIQNYYDHLNTQVLYAFIKVSSHSLADSLYLLLRNGASFSKLAKQNSNDIRTRDVGGNLGRYTLWDFVGMAIDSVAFKLEPGQITTPIKTYQGFYIVKLLEKQPVDRAPFDTLKATITENLKSIKQTDWFENYMTSLYDKYDLTVHKDAIPLVKKVYFENNGIPLLDRLLTDIPSLQKTIVTHKKGAWNIESLIRVFNTTPRYLRHRMNSSEEIIDFVKKSISQELLYFEALELGLDKDAEYQKLVNLNDDALVARRAKEVLVIEQVDVSGQELKSFYEKNKVKYRNQAFEQVKNRIENQVKSEKIMELEKTVIADLERKYPVEINDKEIERLVAELNKQNRSLL
jgi:foldase protein PrsA